jgi:hypothetical protein
MPRLRAPRGDGELLFWPPAEEWPALVERNRRRRIEFAVRSGGDDLRPFPLLHADAPARPDGTPFRPIHTSFDKPVIVTGHQAEPFHPGVWVKNFLVRRLADAVGGSPLNLIVDTDAPRSSVLAVPEIIDGRLAVAGVRFADLRTDTALCEQRLDRDLLRSAARQVCETVHDPDRCRGMGFWAAVVAAAGQEGTDAAEALSAGRIAAEAELLGRTNFERAVSRLPWAEFLRRLAPDAARFAECYNAAVAGFRRAHHVRGEGRPVPFLEPRNGRIELPFWGWRPGGPRRRVFVGGGDVFLDDEPVALREIAVGPRALALTMIVRMFFADLFVHGVGGGVYDEVTDEIIRRFYGVEPPAYVVATATLHLPLPVRPAEDRAALLRMRRDLRFNPERVFDLSDADREWVAEKRGLVAADRRLREAADRRAIGAERRGVRDRIRAINARLAAVAGPGAEADIERRLAESEAAARHNRIARSREWFFGLYPPDTIRSLEARLPDFR